MTIHNNTPATVPAHMGSGRNHETPGLQIWRLGSETTPLRAACRMGEFSVWQEGRQERELFRINLGILAEINRRARRLTQSRLKALPEIRALTTEEVAAIWRACASDPEVRFSASLRRTPDQFGGWRRCLHLAETLLRMQGKLVPWESAEIGENRRPA